MKLRFLSLLLLALGLSATAAHAATSAYAGKYALVVMGTSGPTQSRDALYGTCTVSSAGSVTINLTREVHGSTTGIGQSQVLHGSVSTTGVLNLTGTDSIINVKFTKSGTTVTGLQGTFTPKPGGDNSNSGILLGLKQP